LSVVLFFPPAILQAFTYMRESCFFFQFEFRFCVDIMIYSFPFVHVCAVLYKVHIWTCTQLSWWRVLYLVIAKWFRRTRATQSGILEKVWKQFEGSW
jgi:hypothetical protein